MSRIIIASLIFYKRLVLPSIALSVLFGLVGMSVLEVFSLKLVGFTYMLLGPLFHYFIYEMNNPDEYYFYHNVGLSRFTLWLITSCFGLIVYLTLTSL